MTSRYRNDEKCLHEIYQFHHRYVSQKASELHAFNCITSFLWSSNTGIIRVIITKEKIPQKKVPKNAIISLTPPILYSRSSITGNSTPSDQKYIFHLRKVSTKTASVQCVRFAVAILPYFSQYGLITSLFRKHNSCLGISIP